LVQGEFATRCSLLAFSYEDIMLAKVLSAALFGLDAHLVEVEVDIGGGLPQFSVVGLPDATVRESRDRVRAALKNTGFSFPVKKITVNLAPADLKKEGSGLRSEEHTFELQSRSDLVCRLLLE